MARAKAETTKGEFDALLELQKIAGEIFGEELFDQLKMEIFCSNLLKSRQFEVWAKLVLDNAKKAEIELELDLRLKEIRNPITEEMLFGARVTKLRLIAASHSIMRSATS